MKTFIKKTLVVLIAVIIGYLFIGKIVQVGDTNIINQNILYDLDYPQKYLNDYTLRQVFEGIDDKKITGVGKNLFDGELKLGSLSTTTGDETVATDRVISTNFIKVKQSTAYIFSNDLSYSINVWLYDADKNYISFTTEAFTTPSNCHYIKFRTASTQNNLNVLFQLEQGTTATTYEPYYSTDNLDDWYFVNWYDDFDFGLSIDQYNYWYDIYLTLKELEA